MGCLFSCSCCNRRKKRVVSSELVTLTCFFVTVRNYRNSVLVNSLRIAIVWYSYRVWGLGRECWSRFMNLDFDDAKCQREYQAARKVVLDPIQVDYSTVPSTYSLHCSIPTLVLLRRRLLSIRCPLLSSRWLRLTLDCRHTLIELLFVIHGLYGVLSYPLLLPFLVSLSQYFQDYELFYVCLSILCEW